MAVSREKSDRDDDYTPYWGCNVMDAAANVATVLEPATGMVMQLLSVAARWLDRKCHDEDRRQKR